MSNLKALSIAMLLALLPAVALAQASPEPLGGVGLPISDLSRMTREREAGERFHADTMVTLNMTYNSAGDLRTSLIKHEGHSVFMTLEVNGDLIKGIAKSEKPKVQEAVKPGTIDAKGRWARPGTRLQTRCTGELAVGFMQIVFLPYGGEDGFSCYVEQRNLPEDVYKEWQAGLDADQTEATNVCGSQYPRGTTDYWQCIDSSGVPFPAA